MSEEPCAENKFPHGDKQIECPHCHLHILVDPEYDENGVGWEMCHYCEKEFEIEKEDTDAD